MHAATLLIAVVLVALLNTTSVAAPPGTNATTLVRVDVQFVEIESAPGSADTNANTATSWVAKVPQSGGSDSVISADDLLAVLDHPGRADLLSAPSVTARSGEEATVKVVTECRFPSDYRVLPADNSNTAGKVRGWKYPVVVPSAYETRDVGVTLTVLPVVRNDSRMIDVTIDAEVVAQPQWRTSHIPHTAEDGARFDVTLEQPFFHVRGIKTTVPLYDGTTMVMGGMVIEDANATVRTRVPVLGAIPLLGRLFESERPNPTQRHLYILVTARILP